MERVCGEVERSDGMMEFQIILRRQDPWDDSNKVDVEGDSYFVEDANLVIEKKDKSIAIFAPGSWKYVRVK